jgi:hypothetical protein
MVVHPALSRVGPTRKVKGANLYIFGIRLEGPAGTATTDCRGNSGKRFTRRYRFTQ